MSKHESHPQIINRLKRAQGHLGRVVKMLEEEQGCLEIAQQLSAVENAITNAKRTLVHDHVDHCFDIDLFEKDREQARVLMDEFKSITKYL
ncbi:metal-sensing transcriptional repressor [Salinisphaera sp. LB1]|uniref:metal-sensing transcriptional repressor n=1 Tax=Salinisphaera sp. LB1 TaxID=2183911 RepID=UPI000D708A3C|nr:metal-sensing transcriptional repressor [Salinisphaera sp. LB1]AWN14475.1 NreA-like protein [Salinisphaera sp. LB1]